VVWEFVNANSDDGAMVIGVASAEGPAVLGVPPPEFRLGSEAEE